MSKDRKNYTLSKKALEKLNKMAIASDKSRSQVINDLIMKRKKIEV